MQVDLAHFTENMQNAEHCSSPESPHLLSLKSYFCDSSVDKYLYYRNECHPLLGVFNFRIEVIHVLVKKSTPLHKHIVSR